MSGYLFLCATIAVTVCAQLSFKQYFRSRHRRYVMSAIVMFCLAVPCTYFAVRQLGIGRVYVGTALTYVIAPLAAVRAFRETLHRNQLVALCLIAAGVVLYNFQ